MSRRLINRIADELERTTAADATHERLVSLGWISPSGTPLDWSYWQRQAAWPLLGSRGIEYVPADLILRSHRL